MDTSFIVIIAFQLAVLLFSIMIHEVSHGAVALYLGDDTAKRLGRLTLNPLKHIDPVGSILLPLLLVLFNGPVIFGWAKPVPYNPYNLKNPKRAAAIIAAAGPLSNIVIAVIFSLLLYIPLLMGASTMLIAAFGFIILINLLLAIFNLVPIPPLDGSKLLFALLPNMSFKFQRFLEMYGFFFLILFIFLGLRYLFGFVLLVFALLLTLVGIDPNIVIGAIAGLAGG